MHNYDIYLNLPTCLGFQLVIYKRQKIIIDTELAPMKLKVWVLHSKTTIAAELKLIINCGCCCWSVAGVMSRRITLQ